MKNTLKPLEGWVISLKQDEFGRAVIKLTLRYSAIIFCLLFMVSALVYTVFSLKQGNLIGDNPFVGVFFNEDTKAHENSEELLSVLLLVNLSAWFIASVLAYFLARNTMRPIASVYKQQTKFIADVTHELRTPLAVMRSATEVTLRKERSVPEYKKTLSDVKGEVTYLTLLVNDLLFSLKHKTTPDRTAHLIDFSSLVNNTIKRLGKYASEKGMMVESDIAETVLAKISEEEGGKIISNLFKNAVEHNDKGTNITVTLKTDSNGCGVLVVSDTGCGISPADTKKIFDRFYKVSHSRTHTDSIGGGLGLSIVKEIVETNDGTIKVRSKVGEGTDFVVTLPCV